MNEEKGNYVYEDYKRDKQLSKELTLRFWKSDERPSEEKGDHVFEDFKRYNAISFPIVGWHQVGPCEIVVQFEDGYRVHYSSHTHCFTPMHDMLDMNEDDWKWQFSMRLLALMSSKRMTQLELAVSTGTSQSAISNYVNGWRIPDAITLSKIVRALGCSVTDLTDMT